MPLSQEEKLKKLLSLMEPDGLTEEKFLAMSKKLMEFLKKMKENNDIMITRLKSEIKILQDKIISDNDTNTKNLKNLSDSNIALILKKFEAKSQEISQFISTIKNGKDGKNADEEIIVDKVLKKIIIPKIQDIKNDLPKMGTEIRDALELLNGEDRLRIEAIDGLEDILKELKEKRLLKGGGGFSYIAMDRHIIDDETPSGIQNGTNKDFTILKTPNPLTSLKVYRGGARQRIIEDYTFSGRTITFTIAPAFGEVILCDYRF